MNSNTQSTIKENFWETRRLVRMALFIALSGLGAWITFPSPIGTVAFDSGPGYFLVLYAGGLEGAVVLGIGHLISALKVGFPLGPIHLLIGVLMSGCGIVFWYLKEKLNLIIAAIVVSLLNGVGVTALLIPLVGMGFFISMTPVLLVGSAINIILSILIYRSLTKID
ncbi:ECF transporter S component [Selenihalanaerobacter shriftii]|uniref:Alpha-ribazole transporter n=1 Tax=Selenihalanaerobacter shriftii TaxID=142842 RepID=A0A1T4K061_9FIRM|nr:ECF transporter S component [Selenihalanaerobacter shriftii]SJZ35810.1 alpha-ribazole transporter [Selenihalanaerobacter shriftii]